jgi:hypothetical protein
MPSAGQSEHKEASAVMTPSVIADASGPVTFGETAIQLNLTSIADAKQALKILRLRKKELGLQKKELAREERITRADYKEVTTAREKAAKAAEDQSRRARRQRRSVTRVV